MTVKFKIICNIVIVSKFLAVFALICINKFLGELKLFLFYHYSHRDGTIY